MRPAISNASAEIAAIAGRFIEFHRAMIASAVVKRLLIDDFAIPLIGPGN
jgi:hypothetical protein